MTLTVSWINRPSGSGILDGAVKAAAFVWLSFRPGQSPEEPTCPAGRAAESVVPCIRLQCWQLTQSELQLNFGFQCVSVRLCQSRDLSFMFSSFLSLCSSRGLQLLKVSGREGNLIAIFHEEHSRVLQQLQVFTFFPETLPAAKKPFERKSIDRQSAQKPLLGLVSRELGKS